MRIWIAICRRKFYGTIFFDGNINWERYREGIITPFIEQLDDEETQQGYFQQDGARPDTAHDAIDFLQEFFRDRLISTNL